MSTIQEIMSLINETTEQKENDKMQLNNIDFCDETVGKFNIKIFGVGGAGGNIINTLFNYRTWPDNINIYALNTDVKALKRMNKVKNLYLLGKQLLNGAGSGGDPEVAKISVQNDEEIIKKSLEGTDLLLIICGLGKGTGSGASPEIAKIAKELGILTVAIVNFPSINAEGSQVYKNALNHFNLLKNTVDSISFISNDKIIANNKNNISFIDAFTKANQELSTLVSDIVDLINSATDMNVDYSDIKNFFKNNKNFMLNEILISKFDENPLIQLKREIQTSLFSSYYDACFSSEQINLLANFIISPKVPATFISDTRNLFKQITRCNNLTMINGIDYSGVDGVKIIYLISCNEREDEIKQNLKTNKIEEEENNDYSELLNKAQSIVLEEKKHISQPTVSIGLQHKSIIDNDLEYEEEHEQIKNEHNSDKIVNLFKNAMSEIFEQNNEDNKFDDSIFNNN